MEKRATVIDSIRAADKNLLLVDTGDILGAGINPRRHKYIAKSYKYLKYDIWTPGEQDLIEGKKLFFEALLPAIKTTLNTNLVIEGEMFGNPFVIKEFMWKKIQKTMFGKDSTTKLKKTEEIEKIYDVINKLLSEKFGIYIPFPNKEEV